MPKAAKKVSTKKSSSHGELSFAQQFEELERIVASFEEENTDIDASLAQFERGLHIAEQLKKTLSTTENRIEQLKKKYSIDE